MEKSATSHATHRRAHWDLTLNARGLGQLLLDSVKWWLEHRCFSRAAALAYYAAFSLAPTLVIVIAVAGAVWGRESVEGQLLKQFEGLLGKEGAGLVQQVVRASYLSSGQNMAAAIGLAGTLFGASALFSELSDAVQSLFGQNRAYRLAWLGPLLERIRGLALVVGLGFALLLSLALSAGMVMIGEWVGHWGTFEASAMTLVEASISWVMLSLLFTLMLKTLAPVKISHATAGLGGMMTATLFELGKWAVGLYLGHSSVNSVFGAAGTLAVTLVWLNYAALTVLFGVAFTSRLHEWAQKADSEAPVDGPLPTTSPHPERVIHV